MPLLAACNRVGEKESDSSERTARHWLYANGRKKSYSEVEEEEENFTVPSSVLLLLLSPFPFDFSGHPPGSSCLRLLPLHLRSLLRRSSSRAVFPLRRCASLSIRRGAKLLMPDDARRETTKNERGRRRTGPVISEKSFPRRHSHRHPVFPPFHLAALLFSLFSFAY